MLSPQDQRLRDIAKMRGYYTEEEAPGRPAPIDIVQAPQSPTASPIPTSSSPEALQPGAHVNVYDQSGNMVETNAILMAFDPTTGDMSIQGEQGLKHVNTKDYAVVAI